MQKVTGATRAKLRQHAKGRVRGKNGRFAMKLESDNRRELSWEAAIGIALLVTIVVVFTMALGK